MEYLWVVWPISVLGALYLYRSCNFFQRHGVIHMSSVPILGSMASVVLRRTSFVDFIRELYNFRPNAKYFGFYAMTNPIILIRDVELVKALFVESFSAFPNRPSFTDSNEFLIKRNLFTLQGQEWHHTRSLISSCFSSGRMKSMFSLMSERAQTFSESLSTLPANKSDVDVKDMFTRYTNDIIAKCVYGIEVDSIKDPTNEFYVYGQDVVGTSVIQIIKFILFRTFPTLWRILNLKLVNNRVSSFFRGIVQVTWKAYEDADRVTRSHMTQLMMNIKDKKGERKLSLDDITAQAFFFFLGGYETTSSTLSFAAYEIATNPWIQARLRREIDEALDKSDSGEVMYEIINRLEYLDAFVNEVLRFYPATFLERTCDRTYELPPALPGEKPFVMKKGMVCWIPVYAIHHDEKYYDDPERFDPDRFLNNNTYRNSFHYIPFGMGPRMCLGKRFAILKVKLLLFHLLARCELKPCARTVLPLRFCKKSLFMRLEGGFWLNVQRRSDT